MHRGPIFRNYLGTDFSDLFTHLNNFKGWTISNVGAFDFQQVLALLCIYWFWG